MSRDRFFIWLLVITLICTFGIAVRLGVTAHTNYQNAEVYKDKFLEAQNNYEGTRDQLESVEQALADNTQNLYETNKKLAAERERTAKLRASRSRSVRSTNGVSQRSTSLRVSSSEGPFAGGLRKITMYCPTGGRTASGKIPQRGMVATISRAIPFGTRILIEGLGEYTVEDRIGHGSEFDIFTPSCAEADRFGVEHRRVTIEDVS